MAQQTSSGVRGIPRPVQAFSPKTEAEEEEEVTEPVRINIGAHGILSGRGNKIGRGL